MDIFTTVLTRVVPVPIKPANLKVKALLKDAALGELTEDLDHVENHDYYFAKKESGKGKNDQQKNDKARYSAVKDAESTEVESLSADEYNIVNSDEDKTKSKDGVKHLDLYV